MAGYSGTPLPQKLGIKDGARLGLVRAPETFTRTLGALPAGVVARTLTVCAIDDVWSDLRFVVRLADRPKPSR